MSAADEEHSLEQVLLSIAPQQSNADATNAAAFTASHEVADDDDVAPTSWSFAARQRIECARIARAFKWARQRLRQELRGLALEHAELLLGAVRRAVEAGGGRGTTGRERRVDHNRGRIQEKRLASGLSQRGLSEVGNIRLNEGSTFSKWRYEARPRPASDNRWALAIDEEEMGDLSTLALETSLLKGTGVGAMEVKYWREAFRSRVRTTGGTRHPRELCINPRCKQMG